MQTQEPTRADIGKTLQTCYELAETQTQFFAMLEAQGLTLSEEDGKITGLVIGDSKMSFDDFGLKEKYLESIGITPLTNEDLALIYGEQVPEEKDIIDDVPLPDGFPFDQTEEEPRLDDERGISREGELEELRELGEQVAERELDF